MTDKENSLKEKRVFGRKLGRPIKGARQDALDTLLPALSIPAGDLREDGTLDPASFFDAPYSATWFEIGFGNGEHLSGLMRQHPDTAYIGAEPYINGMANFLKDIKDDPHDHIRVHMDDAMMVANSLSDNSLDGMYVLNPDPWHKKRHHKRRIISQANLECFARILKHGGQLIMSTDVPYLAEWMVTQTIAHGGFEWQAKSAADFWTKPDGWIETVYETKRAKGADRMVYLIFTRK
ncbi:MAG: tRNA (guanine(46)-N(7))-methyltransferase TrmB [Alphaproteobacteria bacterium]